MGLRFRKSVKLCPGVKINFSKSGISTSVGVRGAHLTLGKNGAYSNIGIPGTGIYTRDKIGGTSGKRPRTTATENRENKSVEEITEELNEEAEVMNDAVDKIINFHEETPPEYATLKYVRRIFNEAAPVFDCPSKVLWLSILLFIVAMSFLSGAQIGIMFSGILALCGAAIIYGVLKEREKSKYEDSDAVRTWKEQKTAFENEQDKLEREFKEKIAAGPQDNEDKLLTLLNEVEWPRETLISFELNGDNAKFDVGLPEFEDMPKEIYKVRGRGRSKEIQAEEKSERQQHIDYANHVHGIAFFLARLVFHELTDINEVVISGYTQRASKATGAIEDEYIYSVKIDRATWKRVDMSNVQYIDPVECLGKFEIKRNMTKTGIFKTIEPY